MVSSVLLLCTDPDGFFRRDPKEWAGLALPALLVLVSGIIAAATAFLVTPVMMRIVPEGTLPAGMPALMGAVAGAGAILGSLLAWAAYTLVFYVISLLFMGKGTFTRSLAAVGYGFLPASIGGLINLLLFWYYLPGLQVSPVRDVMDIQAATAVLTHSPIFQLTAAISIIFLLLSANIWIFGIRYSRELSLRNAAITVGTPVLAYVLITLFFAGVFP